VVNRSNPRPVMIAAGGTGGHVFPALVVAQVLARRNVPVVWIGTRRGIEARVIVEAGIPIEWLDVVGLRGKSLSQTLVAPFKIARAVLQAFRLVLKHKPIAVLGMGGFVSGPVGLASRLLARPLVLHEQNAVAGMTNRWLARLSSRVLQAFPGAFSPAVSVETVGNPLRQGIEHGQEQRRDEREVRILVVGGSLGARFFNETLPEVFQQLGSEYRFWHQVGKSHSASVQALYDAAGIADVSNVDEFIDDMQAAYRWADIVICRAGAMTVSELAAAAQPAILIPFPYAVDDHQTKNALFLVDAGAAELVQQRDFQVDAFCELLAKLSDRGTLSRMSERARSIAVLDAGDRVADVLMEVAA